MGNFGESIKNLTVDVTIDYKNCLRGTYIEFRS